MKANTEIKSVIDADNNRIIRSFTKEQTDEVFKHYKSLGKWDDVSIDIDGDIILWKE